MDEDLVALIGAVLALIVLDVAALRFGVDSRTGEREIPVGADSPSASPKRSRRRRRRWKRAAAEDPLVVKQLLIVTVPAGPSASPVSPIRTIDLCGVSAKRPRRWREAPTPVVAYCYQQFDLAARGK